MNTMETYLKEQGVQLPPDVSKEVTLTCPLCSTRINDLGECKATCGAYRKPELRAAHLLVIHPEWKVDNKPEQKKKRWI